MTIQQSQSSIKGVSILIFFLLTANTMLPFPIDKVLLLLLVIYAIAKNYKTPSINIYYVTICIFFFSFLFVGAISNGKLDPMSIYPLVGVLFIAMYKKKNYLEEALYYSLLLHLIMALILYMLSYFIEHPFVRTMGDKGLPNIHASLGFTATNQVLGTLCILWFIVYFNLKEQKIINRRHKIWYLLVVLTLLSTLNRSTLLFFFLLIFFKDKKLLLVVLGILLIVLYVYFQEISTFLLNFNTLTSRSELLEGFNYSYWDSHNPLVYLFGRGSLFLDKDFVKGTTWDYRFDIENGYAFILHGYGALGLLLYLGIAIGMITLLVKHRLYYEACIMLFYMFLSTYFTQEFVTNSFYLMITYLIYSANRKSLARKKQQFGVCVV